MHQSSYVISWIGAKIRELRIDKGWKLGELSDKSGVSIAMLSKIENGRVFPTFPTLLEILKTLSVDLNAFFDGIGKSMDFPGYLHIKRCQYAHLEKEESVGFKYENILTQNFSEISLEISLLTLSPNAKREMVTTEGFEYLFIVKGNVVYQVDEHMLNLHEGDSLYFDGRLPHVPQNYGTNEAVILVIYFIDK